MTSEFAFYPHTIMKPVYSEEEANDILRRAIESMPMKAEMTREQLQSIATEVGISSEALQKAEADLASERVYKVERRAYVTGRRLGLLKHVLFFAAVMAIAFAFAEEADDRGARGMFMVCFFAWGIGLTVHCFDALHTRGEKFDKEFAKWRINRRARELATEELGRIPPRRP